MVTNIARTFRASPIPWLYDELAKLLRASPIPNGAIGMMFVVIPPIIVDLFVVGVGLSTALLIRLCIACTKVLLGEAFHKQRNRVIIKYDARSNPRRLVLLDGVMYSCYHGSIYLIVLVIANTLFEPIIWYKALTAIATLMFLGLFSGPFWMWLIFDKLDPPEAE
jgi:hypothetical protein